MLLDKVCFCCFSIIQNITCQQALQGALAAGREKEGELATTSLEFEYLHGEMLIVGDDISNQNITLGTCFSMFVSIHARFLFTLIDRNLKAQSKGSHKGTGGGIQIPETRLQALLPFPAPPPGHSGELSCRLSRTWHECLFVHCPFP